MGVLFWSRFGGVLWGSGVVSGWLGSVVARKHVRIF